MKKNIKMMIFALALAFVPFISVDAASATVTSQDEFKNALANATIDTIVLDSDITTTEKINITREVTIDGAGHKMTFDSAVVNPDWNGSYLLHVYRTTATIKDITLTGGNAALNVNGSKVTLVGTIDVSGNTHGGIELGKGTGVTEYPYVDASAATLVNTTESELKPTVWTDGITLDEMLDNGVEFVIDESAIEGAVFINDKGQIQLYVKKDNVPSGDNIIDLMPEEDETPEPAPTTTPEVKADTVANTNPNTYDGLGIYVILAILGCCTLGYASKKALSR